MRRTPRNPPPAAPPRMPAARDYSKTPQRASHRQAMPSRRICCRPRPPRLHAIRFGQQRQPGIVIHYKGGFEFACQPAQTACLHQFQCRIGEFVAVLQDAGAALQRQHGTMQQYRGIQLIRCDGIQPLNGGFLHFSRRRRRAPRTGDPGYADPCRDGSRTSAPPMCIPVPRAPRLPSTGRWPARLR